MKQESNEEKDELDNSSKVHDSMSSEAQDKLEDEKDQSDKKKSDIN